MPEPIICNHRDCHKEAVVKFNHLGYETMFRCEPHWRHHLLVFYFGLGVPKPVTETVNNYVELTNEEAELYHKAILN